MVADYLQHCRQPCDFDVPEQVASLIEARSAADTSPRGRWLRDPNAFSRVLNVARLVCKAKGQARLTMESYEESLEMCMMGTQP